MSIRAANMRRRWADPEWAARQRAAITEGMSRCKHKRVANGTKIGAQIQVCARVDPDVFAALQKLARGQQKSMCEIIRTYVEWGLDEEGLLP